MPIRGRGCSARRPRFPQTVPLSFAFLRALGFANNEVLIWCHAFFRAGLPLVVKLPAVVLSSVAQAVTRASRSISSQSITRKSPTATRAYFQIRGQAGRGVCMRRLQTLLRAATCFVIGQYFTRKRGRQALRGALLRGIFCCKSLHLGRQMFFSNRGRR